MTGLTHVCSCPPPPGRMRKDGVSRSVGRIPATQRFGVGRGPGVFVFVPPHTRSQEGCGHPGVDTPVGRTAEEEQPSEYD